MCWSEPADLVMGTIIVGIGGVGAALARRPRDLPLATLPVLLGAHQLLESRIYADSSGRGAVLTGTVVTAWTVIAFVVLPAYAPIVLLVAERQRRRVQYAAAVAGVTVAVVMAVAVSSGVHATDRGHAMDYGAGVPLLPLVLLGYLFATCVPFLTSPERTMRELGVALAVGAGLAAAVDVLAFASIWCAFAAVVSLLVVRRTVHAAHHLSEELL